MILDYSQYNKYKGEDGIVNFEYVNNTLDKLKYLQLSYCNILSDEEQLQLNKLEELHIDNTNITNLSFTNLLPRLKTLKIDKNQYLNNKDLVMELNAKNILVYNENMVEFGGVKDEF